MNYNSESEKSCHHKHIDGIVCDVKNCVHHDGETHCTAKEISVGPAYATKESDTVCATFKPAKAE